MRALIQDFPQHLSEAQSIGSSLGSVIPKTAIQSVVITGLGGSGIGGKVISQWVAARLKVPVLVNNDYSLPAFVGSGTLVIVSSYSGNTEETLSAMDAAMERNAQVAAVTSGGKVLDRCVAEGLTHIVIPGGNPPRSMFGYSSVQLIFMLKAFGLLEGDWAAAVEGIAHALKAKQDQIESDALALARGIRSTTPIIYSEQQLEGVAIRWRQQINENSKLLCWHHVFPEMNHNELVGWETGDERFSVVVLKTSADHPRSRMRMEICEGIFRSKTPHYHELIAQGETLLEQIYYLVHFGDWLSLHLAELSNTDPVDIRNIDFLKSELAAQQ